MSKLLSLLSLPGRVFLGFLLTCGWVWSVLALWFFDPMPGWLRVALAVLWAVSAPVLWFSLPRPWTATAALAAGVLSVVVLWSFHRPRSDREWADDQARMPLAVFDDGEVRVENLRHATYRSVDDYDVEWYEQSFDLEEIESVDFIVEPFSSLRGLAHTLLSFGFADGEHVAISVETRRERGEAYSPVKGLFRQYEPMYVCGDERDLIGMRANVRKNPVHLFPVRATKEQVRALFVSMLKRSTELAERPRFYNTLTSTCATSILHHLEELLDRRLPFDFRVVFPGFADSLAYDLGIMNNDLPLEELRERCLINGRSGFGAGRREWSRQIRGHTSR